MQERNLRIDVLKGIAIFAVVLYHFGGGYLTFGYLGVDIFFVISGYFMMKSMVKSMKNNRFSYRAYLMNRIVRLWPMVLIMGAISLVIGMFTMLPDDLENLSESIIASNIFANNVLSCITTRNYWDIANTFKPLMHTWYVGVLMQAFIVFPLIYLGIFRLTKGSLNAVKVTTVVITLVSLIVYLLPYATSAEKFYYLPYRAFEMAMGSLIAFIPWRRNVSKRMQYAMECLCWGIIVILLCVNQEFISASAKLLLVVCATTGLVYLLVNTEVKTLKSTKIISCMGKASFSIYLCHQIVVAYMYYAVTDRTDICTLMLFLVAVAVISGLVYFGVEKPLEAVAKKKTLYVLIPSAALFLVTSVVSGMIYLNAGVIRDVPELGIEKSNVHRGMHAEYCDIPYAWDRDFSSTDKVKVAVIGDSFGRDWANILNESDIADQIEISYIYPYSQKYLESVSDRWKEADIVFRSISTSTSSVSDSIPDGIPSEKLYIVGYKNFGSSNGIIYNHRGSKYYFDQTITLNHQVLTENQMLRDQYGDHFIDMIGSVQQADGSVRVFTDDQHFISQDCRHLTQYGAQYYARIMDLSWIIGMKNEN